MSEHASIHHALAAAQAEFPVVPKDRKAKVPTKAGSSYEYRYADFGSILAAIEPVLRRHGIMQYQRLDVRDGKQLLCTELWHSSGTSVCASMLVPLDGRAPQEVGSCITYFRRYSMVALLGLVTEEDNDAQHTRARARPTASPAQPPAQPPVRPQQHAPRQQQRPQAVQAPHEDVGEARYNIEGYAVSAKSWIEDARRASKSRHGQALLEWWATYRHTREMIYRRHEAHRDALAELSAEIKERAGRPNGTGQPSPDQLVRAG
jgi:hypothetical protein